MHTVRLFWFKEKSMDLWLYLADIYWLDLLLRVMGSLSNVFFTSNENITNDTNETLQYQFCLGKLETDSI